jgi:hypothetical protein
METTMKISTFRYRWRAFAAAGAALPPLAFAQLETTSLRLSHGVIDLFREVALTQLGLDHYPGEHPDPASRLTFSTSPLQRSGNRAAVRS